MSRWIGYGAVLLSAAAFGAGSIVVQLLYREGITPEIVMIMTNLAATLMVWLVALKQSRIQILSPKLWLRMAAQGMISGFLNSLIFFYSLERLGTSLATLMLFTFPAYVALYQHVRGMQLLSPSKVLALVLTLIGLMFSLNVWDQNWNLPVSYWLIGLASAWVNAFASINSEILLQSLNPLVVAAWGYLCSFCFISAYYWPWQVWLTIPNLSAWQASLFLLSALFNVGPLFFYLLAIRHIGAGLASLMSTLEIPFTLLAAALILQEVLTPAQWLGGGFITAAVVLLYYTKKE